MAGPPQHGGGAELPFPTSPLLLPPLKKKCGCGWRRRREKGGGGTLSLLEALRRKGRGRWVLRGSIFNWNYAAVVCVKGGEGGVLLKYKRWVPREIKPVEGMLGENTREKAMVGLL